MKLRQVFLGLACMIFMLTAAAIETTPHHGRWFPVGAKRGVANFSTYPKLYIDDVERKTAPGLRIWNTMNRIQFHPEIKGENVTINYTEDALHAIDRIWILTPREAEKPLKPGLPS